ncbi:MAG: hypothetical protein AB7K86_23475 [Rhodospirillales bacterium]
MTPFLDHVAAWFAAFGIHPVLGAFAAGALAALVLRPRRRDAAKAPDAAFTVKPGATSSQIVAPDGRALPIPPQVVHDARNGNKIAAIKALRKAIPMDLVEAKRIVEQIAGH